MSNPPHSGTSGERGPADPSSTDRPRGRPRIRPGTSDVWHGAPQSHAAADQQHGPVGDGAIPSPPSAPPHSQPSYSNYYEYLQVHSGQQPIVTETTPPPPPPPPAPRRSAGPLLLAITGALVLTALVVTGIVLLEQRNRAAPSPASMPEQTSSLPDEGGSAPGSTPEAEATEPVTDADALEELERLRQDTLDSSFDRLNGSWVAQLSAKQEGLRADGVTWTNGLILESYEDYRSRYPDAVLTWSGDWTTFQMDDFWVVVIDEPHDDPDEALEFCRGEGYSRDDCFAKKLSDSEGEEDSTRLLPED